MVDAAAYVSRLREIGPATWAEAPYGWTGEDGKPITLTPWQRAALNAWWNNRAEVTTFAISNVKKTGKTFLDALLLAWRWLALPGVHFAVGNDLDQSATRQFGMIADMVKRNPYLSQVVKVTGRELRFEPTNSTLAALAVDAAGNAGANHLTASHTEAWGIIYEAGIRAYEELTPPPGRFYELPALRILDSYAGFEAESNTWHGIVDRGLEGKRVSEEWPIYKAGGLLLFHMEGEEARRRCFRGTPEEAAQYYEDQKRELRPNAFLRMHGNERTAGESAFVPEGAWEACYSPSVKPLEAGQRVKLVVGADASTSGDYTALVGCVYDYKTEITDVKLVRVWKPRTILGIRGGKATVDIDETIGQAVLDLHASGQLRAVVCDVYQLHTCVIRWEKAGIKVIELNQNAGRVDSDQGLYNAINSMTIRHYNDPELNRAVRNAVARETPRGFRLDKEKASKKIDAAVALSMAYWGARLYFGRIDDSGPAWIPDPWEVFDSEDLSEMDPGQLDMVRRWELEAKKPYNGHWHINARPHPAGVTWRECRHRNKGCLACVEEMDADGTTEAQRQQDELMMNSINPDVEGLERRFIERQAQIAQDNARAEEVTRRFWKNVKTRLDQ